MNLKKQHYIPKFYAIMTIYKIIGLLDFGGFEKSNVGVIRS